ncbi:hypothetical protein V7146_16460 [Gottfriedia acidiceleris]|uniref:hypothetical protein n=1 Tax=Gottfriedia acidiceleris TaxID=371036 RepID=UPI002FFF7DD4
MSIRRRSVSKRRRNSVSIGMSSNESASKLKFGDLAILITLIPVLGYGITYCMEVGKATYYDYPVSLIKIDVNNMSKVCIIMFCFLLGIVHYYLGFSRIDSNMRGREKLEKEPELLSNIREDIILTIIVFFLVIIFSLGIISLIKGKFSIALIVANLFPMFILMAFRSFKKKSYFAAITISILLTLILPLLISYTVELSRGNYTLIEFENSKYVVVNGAQEKVLIAPVDLKKKEITPKYSLIEIKTKLVKSDNKKEETLSLKNENTGHLQLKGKEATPTSFIKYIFPVDW